MDFVRKLTGRHPRIHNLSEWLLSAVLVPIVEIDGVLHILFEIRSSKLERQPGEICFPGGRIELDELAHPQRTAVRETVEELGIHSDQVVLLGPLDFQMGPPGTWIFPYLGFIEDFKGVTPNPLEVEDTFLAPMDHFIEPKGSNTVEVAVRYINFPFEKLPDSYRERENWFKQWSYTNYYYEYGEHFIWGVTARILKNVMSLYSQLQCNS